MKLEHLVHREDPGADRLGDPGAKPSLDNGTKEHRRRPTSLNLRHPALMAESSYSNQHRHISLASSPATANVGSQEVTLPSIHTLVNTSEASALTTAPQSTTSPRPNYAYRHSPPEYLYDPQNRLTTGNNLHHSRPPGQQHYSALTCQRSTTLPDDRRSTYRASKDRQLEMGVAQDSVPFPSTETGHSNGHPIVGLPFSPTSINGPATFPYLSLSTAARPRSVSQGNHAGIRHGSNGTMSSTISFDGSPEFLQTGISPKWQHRQYLAASAHAAYANQLTERYTCPTCSKPFSRPSSLRIHSHSHSGEKPFVCSRPNCRKAFSVRSNMRRHERGCHGGG